jgi:hypothetical protein
LVGQLLGFSWSYIWLYLTDICSISAENMSTVYADIELAAVLPFVGHGLKGRWGVIHDMVLEEAGEVITFRRSVIARPIWSAIAIWLNSPADCCAIMTVSPAVPRIPFAVLFAMAWTFIIWPAMILKLTLFCAFQCKRHGSLNGFRAS